jgi:hypothetical protein
MEWLSKLVGEKCQKPRLVRKSLHAQAWTWSNPCAAADSSLLTYDIFWRMTYDAFWRMSERSFRLNASVHAEIDFRLPEDGSHFRERAESWFADAIGALAGHALDPFVQALDLTGRASVLAKGSRRPYGRPGELWGSLWLTRQLKSGRRLTGKVWSPKNWAGFLRDLESFPLDAKISLTLLGPDGYPGSTWITIGARRDEDAAGWVALMVDRSSETFMRDQPTWKDFILRQTTKGPVCMFGYIADDSVAHRTLLESALGIFQDETFPTLDYALRGYSWITLCSAGVAERLGGAQAVRDTGAFHEVSVMRGGGLLLQATEDIRDYHGERIVSVFNALRSVLPEEMPTRFISEMGLRLVFPVTR